MCTPSYSPILVSLILFRRNKAVADGAVSFYLDRRVSVRVAKNTYGVECVTSFDPANIEHLVRSNTKFTGLSGQQYIRNKFTAILAKVCGNYHSQISCRLCSV